MLRSLALMSALTVALTLPAAAQKLTEQDARKIAETLLAMDNKAWQDRSSAEEAALYHEDGIRVFPKGSSRGRAAVEQFFSAPMTAKDFVTRPVHTRPGQSGHRRRHRLYRRLVRNMVSPKGPIQYKGRWAKTVVREGDTWKAVLSADNAAPQE